MRIPYVRGGIQFRAPSPIHYQRHALTCRDARHVQAAPFHLVQGGQLSLPLGIVEEETSASFQRPLAGADP